MICYLFQTNINHQIKLITGYPKVLIVLLDIHNSFNCITYAKLFVHEREKIALRHLSWNNLQSPSSQLQNNFLPLTDKQAQKFNGTRSIINKPTSRNN